MDIDFNYKIRGEGISLFFQHGLGGNLKQPQKVLQSLRSTRIISMDCRGHGKTPFTGKEDVSFNQYADDVIALADKLKIRKAVFGGISMGAGIALNIAVRYPDRVKGLILLRPAWLDKGNPQNLLILRMLAHLITENKSKEITERIEFQHIKKISENAAEAVVGQLEREQSEHTADILFKMTSDRPIHDLKELSGIRVPTLVLGNHHDPMHPFETAKIIADYIPGSALAEVAPRYLNPEAHSKEVVSKVKHFICKNLLT